MGSTSRANGGVRAQFTTPVNIAFSRYTIEALRELDATSSGLVGYRPVGYLFLAGTEASEAWLRSAYLTQRGHSVASSSQPAPPATQHTRGSPSTIATTTGSSALATTAA